MLPAEPNRFRAPNEDLAIRILNGVFSGMMLATAVSPILGTFSLPAARAIRQHGTLMLLGGALGGFNSIRMARGDARTKRIATQVLLIGTLLAKAALEFYSPIPEPTRWAAL